MSDDAEFREAVARECCDAVVDLWIAMAESLAQSGVIDPGALQGTLRRVLNLVAATRPNSISHYALDQTYQTYLKPEPSDVPPGRPVWFRSVIDGGKDKA